MPSDIPKAPQRSVLLWDAPTRLFHWLIVGLVVFLWWSAENNRMDWHRVAGLAVVGLLVFRLYWGIVGSTPSRFAAFMKGPKATLAYARTLFSPKHQLSFGHNPLGALSVAAILVALAAQAGLGLFAVDVDGLESGPFARFVSFELGRVAAQAHETTFNILLALIALHVAAILFYVLVKRANLVGPMITGRRAAPAAPEAVFQPAPLWRAGVGIALSALVVWLIGS